MKKTSPGLVIVTSVQQIMDFIVRTFETKYTFKLGENSNTLETEEAMSPKDLNIFGEEIFKMIKLPLGFTAAPAGENEDGDEFKITYYFTRNKEKVVVNVVSQKGAKTSLKFEGRLEEENKGW